MFTLFSGEADMSSQQRMRARWLQAGVEAFDGAVDIFLPASGLHRFVVMGGIALPMARTAYPSLVRINECCTLVF
jgi:hypothetical protein